MKLEASCYLAFIVFASVLERPFVTRAGVKKGELRASLFANIVASPAWLVFAEIAEDTMTPSRYRVHDDATVLFVFAFAYQFLVKTLVIRISARKPIDFRYIFGGTSFSLTLAASLFATLVSVNDGNPELWIKMTSYVPQFTLLSYALFLGMVLVIAIQTVSAFITKTRALDGTETATLACGQEEDTDA